MKTLQDVAKKYKQVAQQYIRGGYSGWKKPPYDTGNLYNTIGSFNNDQRMIFTQKNKYFITLNYAPSGAAYGKYVEKGTSKMKARPFAGNAAKSPELRKTISEYQDSLVTDINDNVQKRVTVIFEKAGFEKK
jgi:hypothetical protein